MLIVTMLSCLFLLGTVLVSVVLGKSPCTSPSDGRLAHPVECQLYYDCSRPVSDLPRVTEANLFECKYPDLFDQTQGICRNFEAVTCGSRKIILDICETVKFRNAGTHGRPCHVDNLDCRRLSDGKHAFEHMPDTPYFGVCFKKRFFGKHACKDEHGQFLIFDPVTETCNKPDDN